MTPELPEEAIELAEAAGRAFDALGGVEVARRAEADPDLRAREVLPVLEQLGVGDLDPRGSGLALAAAATAVAEDHEPGWALAAPADGEDRMAAFAGQPVFIPDLDLHARAARDGRGLFGEGLGIHVVGRDVDEPAGEVHAGGDDRTAFDGLGRCPEPYRRAERGAFPLGAVEVLPHHAHGASGHRLLDLSDTPCGVGHERHPRSGSARELPRGRGGGPIERAGVEILPPAESHHEELCDAEPGRCEQRHALEPLAGDLTRRHEAGEQPAGRAIHLGTAARGHATLGEKHDEGLGFDRVGAGAGVGDDAVAAMTRRKLGGCG